MKIIKAYTNFDGDVVVYYREDGIKHKKIIKYKPYYWKKDNDEFVKVFYNYDDRLNVLTDNNYEADLLSHRLWLLDNEVEFEDNYKILYFDIETRDDIGSVEIGRDRVISICCVDNEGHEYKFCEDDERTLLKKFIDILPDYDVLIGWNSEFFDVPYIRARLKTNKLYYNFDDINRLDLMKIFMKSYLVQKKLGELSVRSYALATMSKIFINDTKLETEEGEGYGGRLWNLFQNDRATLLKYNLQDVILLKRLNEKLNLLMNQIELSKMAKVNLEDTTFNSRIIDAYILRKARTMNIHFKSVKRGLDKAKFEGGICEISKPGLYENVVVFDFSSLYPNLIRTFNISPETMLPDNYEGDCCVTFNGVKYSRTKGVIPLLIEELINYRYKLRDEQDKLEKGSEEYTKAEIKQVVVKVLSNSFYGILGSAFTRYFSLKLATSITSNGQAMMRKIIAFIKTKDYCTWLSADTDSCFISFKSLDFVDTFKQEIKQYVDKIIKEQTGSENKYLDFKQEKMFSRFILVAKKKYVGICIGENKLYPDKNKHWKYLKGLENVKGDYLIVAKELLTEIVDSILSGKTIDDIVDIVNKYKKKILTNRLKKEDLILVKRISKMPEGYKTLPAHVKMAIDRKKLGERFYVNMRINYIIVTSNPLTVVHPSEFKGKFDKLHYWETMIFNPTKRVLDIVYPSVDWESIANIKNAVVGQQTL